MKSKIVICLLLLYLPMLVCANTLKSTNEYLLSAISEANETVVDQSKAQKMPSITKWIEDAQIRLNTKSDENLNFENNNQSYEIRLKPKAWGQVDAEEKVLKLLEQEQSNWYQQTLNLALQKRYKNLIFYIAQRNKTRHLLNLSRLLSIEFEVTRSHLLGENFKAEKLLDTEDNYQQTKNLAELNLRRLNVMQNGWSFEKENANDLMNSNNMNWLIGLNDILKTITVSNEITHIAPDVANIQLQADIAQAEVQLTNVKKRIGINLIKFARNDRNNDDMEFQVGVNIPLGIQFDNVKEEHVFYKAKSELTNQLGNLSEKLNKIQDEIKWLEQEQRIILVQINRINKLFQKDYIESDPILSIKLRKETLMYEKRNADIIQQARSLYIDFLFLTGQLVQKPLRNWLQQGTPKLLTHP